jgi:L-threonate 2-dehydrogenase
MALGFVPNESQEQDMTISTWAGEIGIIGIGAMGWPIAKNLQRLGRAPRVRDIDAQASAAAVTRGLRACASAAELASACDVIVLVVVDAAQIDEVLFGKEGVVQARRPVNDAPRQTVVICSTIGAADTERYGRQLAEHHIDLIDAPISGGPLRAGDGSMSMMVAAERGVFERCEPLLREMASSLHFVGERLGDAARTKLVNNLLAGINLIAGAEALALGSRLGLDPRMLFDVINASSGASWVFKDRMGRALEHDFAPRARASILTKDVGLAVQMAKDAGIATPLGMEALAVFRAAVAAGLGELDDAAVIKLMSTGF